MMSNWSTAACQTRLPNWSLEIFPNAFINAAKPWTEGYFIISYLSSRFPHLSVSPACVVSWTPNMEWTRSGRPSRWLAGHSPFSPSRHWVSLLHNTSISKYLHQPPRHYLFGYWDITSLCSERNLAKFWSCPFQRGCHWRNQRDHLVNHVASFDKICMSYLLGLVVVLMAL